MKQLFGRVMVSQTLWRHRGGHVHFIAKNTMYFKKHQNHYFSPTGRKMAELWPKNVCPLPIYGIIDIFRAILAYNLAECQYSLLSLSLFDEYYQIPYPLQFSVQYHVKCGFYPQKKPSKKA